MVSCLVREILLNLTFNWGVCKTRTGYLRLADADGKMRIEKCGWKKKTRNADKKIQLNN